MKNGVWGGGAAITQLHPALGRPQAGSVSGAGLSLRVCSQLSPEVGFPGTKFCFKKVAVIKQLLNNLISLSLLWSNSRAPSGKKRSRETSNSSQLGSDIPVLPQEPQCCCDPLLICRQEFCLNEYSNLLLDNLILLLNSFSYAMLIGFKI